jgi:hypothetical protein
MTILRSALIDDVEREIHMNARSHADAERTPKTASTN